VDGKSVADVPLQRVVQMVRGPAGTTVSLRVQRGAMPQPLEVDLTRARLEVPDVTWERIEGKPVAHVALRGFGRHTDVQLKGVLRDLRRLGVKGVLLDLRGNPGGLKEQ